MEAPLVAFLVFCAIGLVLANRIESRNNPTVYEVSRRMKSGPHLSGRIDPKTEIPDATYPQPQSRSLPEEPPRRELRGKYPTLSWHYKGAPFCAGWNRTRGRYYVSSGNDTDIRVALFRRQADMEACVKEMGYRGELP